MADYEAIAGQNVLENVLNCYKFYNRFLLAQGFEFIKKYYTTPNNGLYSYRSFQEGKQSDLPITEKIKTFFLEGIKNGRLEQDCDMGNKQNVPVHGESGCDIQTYMFN